MMLILVFVAACAPRPTISPVGLEDIDRSWLPEPDRSLEIAGLGPCSDREDRDFSLDGSQPVTVIVHGCYGSAGRLRSLSEVYAFHGQQSICFEYDDRDSLEKSSAELIEALDALAESLEVGVSINVLAHSQGGLIARRAAVENRPDGRRIKHAPEELVTVSAPFAGISAASPCGSRLKHVLSLGITVGICRYISGDKWWEITSSSDFIRQPGQLVSETRRHLKVVTDERDSCRIQNDSGECLSRDGVFGLEEQYFSGVDADPRVSNVEVRAGHVEIVGDADQPPVKLIEVLQAAGLLQETPLDRRVELEALLARLYQAG
ncbi:hypothetical protein J2T60_001052 [Natronospira proteinivora]|uniref:Alpha/beta hydrolase family protein n=1 Tax=Natronospira proteinivora TaxID=1807133 RepID=A0ABT1GB10_9GAMM|nr:hypothetical protein [Natronospira proteinivora]MCP1727087.1 hypothetical protein [Natronospira proteinivora]